MVHPSPIADEVFGNLRVSVVRELARPEVDDLLRRLVQRGWRARQLADRVGVLPVQATPEQDAEVIVAALTRLLEEQSPQERYDAELAWRERRRAEAREEAPTPAAPEDRQRWITAIRSGLKGRSRVPFGPPVRLRPDCSLCEGEAQFFVRRDVHLCASCVDLLAAGQVKAERATGT